MMAVCHKRVRVRTVELSQSEAHLELFREVRLALRDSTLASAEIADKAGLPEDIVRRCRGVGITPPTVDEMSALVVAAGVGKRVDRRFFKVVADVRGVGPTWKPDPAEVPARAGSAVVKRVDAAVVAPVFGVAGLLSPEVEARVVALAFEAIEMVPEKVEGAAPAEPVPVPAKVVNFNPMRVAQGRITPAPKPMTQAPKPATPKAAPPLAKWLGNSTSAYKLLDFIQDRRKKAARR
jgi:hypothetical protein